jgi:transposase
MHTIEQTSQAGRESVTGIRNPAGKLACIKLAVDVHVSKYKVVRQLGDLSAQPAQTFSPEQFLKFARKQVELADKVWCCYEAGPTGFWLHRELTKSGVQALVVVPARLDAYGRKVNNDSTDARALGSKLSRYVAGEKEALAVVRVPTPQQESQRALSRQRSQFGKILRSLAAMGRSACLLQGYRLRGPWWRLTRWLKICPELPAGLQEHLERFLPLMAESEKQIALLTKSLQAAAPKPLPFGMGALTFSQIEREVLDWKRFSNRKQPGSFAGLCGGVSASGQQHADLPITKHGNPRLRALLIEWAWRMVLFQPQARAVQRWKNVLLDGRVHSRRRKQAIVALARQLLVDLWRWRTGRATAEKLGWQMSTEEMSTPVSTLKKTTPGPGSQQQNAL